MLEKSSKWMKVPRWCSTDIPVWSDLVSAFSCNISFQSDTRVWKKGDTAKLINGYAKRHANVIRFGTFWLGLAFYPSKVAGHFPNLKEGFDPLLEAVDTVRKNNMHIIAYINPNAHCYKSNLYKTACIIDETGKPFNLKPYGKSYSRYPCINNPEFREFYVKAIQELVGDYGVDGIYFDGLSSHICYCKLCKEKFKYDTGRNLPSGLFKFWNKSPVLWEMTSDLDVIGDVQNPMHVLYSKWMMKCLADITKFFTSTTKDIRKDAVMVYHTWPKHDLIKYYDGTLSELYDKRVFTLWKKAEFSNWSNVFEVPSIINIYLRHQQPHIKKEYGISSEVEARHLYWQVIANGAYPNSWSYTGMEQPFRILKKYADYFDFSTVCPMKFIALARSMQINSQHRKINFTEKRANKIIEAKASTPGIDPGSSQALLDRFISPGVGMYAGLLHAGLPIKEIHSNHITKKGIDGFSILVLANEVCLSNEQCKMIQKFVCKGGGLIATGETSLYNLNGKRHKDFGLKNLFGVSLSNLQDCNVPRVFTNEFGKGRVVYIHGKLDSNYSFRNDVSFPALIRFAVEWVSKGNVPVQVFSPHGIVGVTCFDQPSKNRRIIHLVNYNADWSAPFDKLPVIKNVRLNFKWMKISSVRAILSNKLLKPIKKDNGIEVILPRFAEYEIVEVKFERKKY